MTLLTNAIPRFEKYRQVGRMEDCWLWVGAKSNAGYGAFSLNKKQSGLPAHRIAYQLAYGKLTPGLTIDHTCRNRSCVNPLHLEEVSSRENSLRSERNWVYINAIKSHCINGHEFTEETTYIDPGGWRQCKPCKRERNRAYREAKKSA